MRHKKAQDLHDLNDSKAFIECSDYMGDIYNNIEEYNLNKKRKLLIVFDDMIADILSKEKLNPTVTELFIRGRKLNICLVISRKVFSLFQKYYTKFCTLFYYEKSKQTRISIKCI